MRGTANDIDTTDAEYQRLLKRRRNPNWAREVEQMLRLDQPFAMYSADLDREVNEYLDHFGELSRDIFEVSDESHNTTDGADRARRTLHNHMLVINLLLRKIEVHEYHRDVRMWHERQAAEVES